MFGAVASRVRGACHRRNREGIQLIHRRLLALAASVAVVIATSVAAFASSGSKSTPRDNLRSESALPPGFKPAITRAQSSLGRYFVVMDQPSVAQKAKAAGGALSAGA